MVNTVLIIGGGIGGLSTTIALRRAGIDVDLVEIKTEWKVYHVGIIVQGNFIRSMAALGIADKAVAAGFPGGGVEFQTLHGQVVAAIPGTVFYKIWNTNASPAPIPVQPDNAPDPTLRPIQLHPTPKGSIIRFVDIPH